MSTEFRPEDFGPVAAGLLADDRLPALGPGTPNRAVRSQLDAASVDALFAHARITDRSMADACRSGLWLYHDFLDESHTISQSISTTTGSYWHGVMHRREPDAGNAKYWFNRVGDHPIFDDLAAAARALAGQASGLKHAAGLADADTWDPFEFIDLCERCRPASGADHDLCRQVSLAEWRLLFAYSYRSATS